jgi:hypothetical protein
MTAEAPIETTNNGATPLSKASDTSHVIAIPIAAPNVPIKASLLLLFGEGKIFIQPTLVRRDQTALTHRQIV